MYLLDDVFVLSAASIQAVPARASLLPGERPQSAFSRCLWKIFCSLTNRATILIRSLARSSVKQGLASCRRTVIF